MTNTQLMMHHNKQKTPQITSVDYLDSLGDLSIIRITFQH